MVRSVAASILSCIHYIGSTAEEVTEFKKDVTDFISNELHMYYARRKFDKAGPIDYINKRVRILC